MKEMTFISLIVYAHNEEQYIADFILKMDSLLNNNFNSYEIIVVNDDSNDNTENEIFKIKDIVKGNVTVVNLHERHGVDRALFAGTDISIGDFIFELESITIDYPMELILDMYKKSSVEGFDIVLAKNQSSEKFLDKTYINIMKGLSSQKINLDNSQLRLVTRRALYSMANSKDVVTNRNIMYKNCGFEWTNIFYNPISPKLGKRTPRKVTQDLKVIMLYTKLFSRLPFLLSVLFLLSTVVVLLIGAFDMSFVDLGGSISNTVIAFISFGFSLVFLVLGIMYKSIDILMKTEVNTNPYKVKSIKRINRY